MYSTCLFCHGPLGRNDVVETFPVGRALAFDAAKGRLWVVCPRCARWNLTPLDERWEAIATCERLFRAAPLRAATDHVRLAHAPDGTRLVRIGAADHPELAVWRYDRQFRQRRWAARAAQGTVWTASLAGGMLGIATLPGTLGTSGMWIGGAVGLAAVTAARWRTIREDLRRRRTPVAALPYPDVHGDHMLRAVRVVSARLYSRPAAPGGWKVRLGYRTTEGDRAYLDHINLAGEPAVRAVRTFLPALNAAGGSRREVDHAVARLGGFRDGAHLTATLADEIERQITKPRELRQLRRADRLALEMALAEDTERLAMDGGIAALEQAWREAEEIAAIADDLVLPASVRTRWETLRSERDQR